MTHTANALEVQVDQPKAKRMVIQNALETQCTQTLQSATQTKEEIEKILTEIRNKSMLMNEKWTEELSRKFLPKFALNKSTSTFHAVRDSLNTGCGYEYRNTRKRRFTNEIPDPDASRSSARMRKKAGCVKMLEAYARSL